MRVHVRHQWVSDRETPPANFAVEASCILLWMITLLVLPEIWTVQICLTTHMALVGFITSMTITMGLQVKFGIEPFPTYFTFKLVLAQVPPKVHCKVWFVHGCISTYITYKVPASWVDLLVSSEFILSLVWLVADAASVWTIIHVGHHVSLELLVCVEDLLTWTTMKFSSMCSYMEVQFHFAPVYHTTYYAGQTVLGFPTNNWIHSVLCRWMWDIFIVTTKLTQRPRKKIYSICFIHCNEQKSYTL